MSTEAKATERCTAPTLRGGPCPFSAVGDTKRCHGHGDSESHRAAGKVGGKISAANRRRAQQAIADHFESFSLMTADGCGNALSATFELVVKRKIDKDLAGIIVKLVAEARAIIGLKSELALEHEDVKKILSEAHADLAGALKAVR